MSISLSDDLFDIYYDMTRSAMVVLLANGSPREAVTYGRDETGIVLVHNEEEYYFFLGGIPENELANIGFGREKQLEIYIIISNALRDFEAKNNCKLELTMYLPNRVYTLIVSPDRCGRTDMQDVFYRIHEIICNAYTSVLGTEYTSGRMISAVTKPLSGYGMHVQNEFAKAMDCICIRRYFLQGSGVVCSSEQKKSGRDISNAALAVICEDIRFALETSDDRKLQELLRELFLGRLKAAENIEQCSRAAGAIFRMIGEEEELPTLRNGLFIEDFHHHLESLCLKYLAENPRRKGLCSREIAGVDEYLAKHFTHDISLDELAKTVGLNRTYLCSKYKNEKGYTIHSRILSLRLEYARQLLATTDESIESIALKSGFNEPNYFRSCFRKRIGTTPSEYRILCSEI